MFVPHDTKPCFCVIDVMTFRSPDRSSVMAFHARWEGEAKTFPVIKSFLKRPNLVGTYTNIICK
ncbi:hypothetical protein D6779_09820 [Candidatus Parcubacteria bacterium]|nr:MAG: hypothetical protein D6779_09820 [Candidatus Parcubacteria bacterium]